MWETDYRILSELIKPAAIVYPEPGHYGQQKITLNEPKDNYAVTIKNVPENIFVLNADAFPPSKEFFQNTKSECKRCDFVILVAYPVKKYAIFVELKSKPDTNTESLNQLKAAACLFEYCRHLGQVFWQEENFLQGYQKIFVIIKRIPKQELNKKKTRPKPKEQQAQLNGINGSVSGIPHSYATFFNHQEFYFKKFFEEIIGTLS